MKNRGWSEFVSWATFVQSDGTPDPLPYFEFFRTSPNLIESNDDSTLSWSVLNATSCTGSGGSGSWPPPAAIPWTR